MFAIATAALLALSATAEAATSKYDYGGREKYKHHGSYKPYYKHGAYEREHMRGDSGYEDYSPEPSYASPYADQEYSREALYESPYADREYREPHHDSYDEDNYGRDAYSVEPSYTYEEDDMENKRRKPRSVRYVQSRPTYWPWYRPYKTYKPYRTYWPTYRTYWPTYKPYRTYRPTYKH